ncbi:endonuclease/exonuclease/phosphatase family protein [Kiritimatiellaeota bacterium B1221]|nr:endonuclease/exonuclease/phosphatase family protein [Kiritimatiellaeota bacterium B1221]
MKFAENRLADFLFGCVFAVGLLASLATALLLFAHQHWMLDLFTHFRVQMAAGLLLAAFILIFSEMKFPSLIFLGCVAAHMIEIVPLYLPVERGEGATFKVLLFNVNSSTGDPDNVLAYLKKSDADIIVLQEYSMRWTKVQKALHTKYPHQLSVVRGDNFGMALFSRRSFLSEEIFYFTDDELPSLGVEFEHQQQKVFFLATHPLPPASREYSESRNLQLTEIARFLADSSGPVILAGDLNTSPWSPIFKDLLKISGLKNSMQGYGIQPTWPTVFPPLWIPLDHLLHSDEFTITERQLGPQQGSDHFPVEVTLSL